MGRLNPSSYNLFLLMIGLCVLVGTIVVYRLRRDVEEESGAVTDADLLREFERAYYSGEMEEAEFLGVTAALRARAGIEPKSPKPRANPDPPPTLMPDSDDLKAPDETGSDAVI